MHLSNFIHKLEYVKIKTIIYTNKYKETNLYSVSKIFKFNVNI